MAVGFILRAKRLIEEMIHEWPLGSDLVPGLFQVIERSREIVDFDSQGNPVQHIRITISQGQGLDCMVKRAKIKIFDYTNDRSFSSPLFKFLAHGVRRVLISI